MSLVKIEVDPGNVLQRQFTELERSQLPFVAMQAANRTAEEVKYQWDRLIQTRLDQPVPLTVKSVRLDRARYVRGAGGKRANDGAMVSIRDQAAKGTPPARYLLPQVMGGTGHARGIDKGLRRAGYLGPSEYAVAVADNTLLDARGNIKGGVVQQILSQLGGQFDPLTNETAASRARNAGRGKRKAARGARNRRFFAVSRHGKGRVPGSAHLSPGVYWRDGEFDLTKVYHFVSGAPRYGVRLDLFRAAQQAFNSVYEFQFERELSKAIQTAIYRGRR